MGDLVPGKAERQHCDRRMIDTGERREPFSTSEVEIDIVQAVRRSRVHHRIVDLGRLVGGGYCPSFRPTAQLGDGSSEPQLGFELPAERVDDLLQSAWQGE